MSPTLDHDALARLGEDLDDDDLLLDLAQELLAALPERLASLRAAPPEEARRAAHTLKSSARLMGLVDLGEHAAHLEQAAPDWSPSALAVLEQLAVEAAAALRAWLERAATGADPLSR